MRRRLTPMEIGGLLAALAIVMLCCLAAVLFAPAPDHGRPMPTRVDVAPSGAVR